MWICAQDKYGGILVKPIVIKTLNSFIISMVDSDVQYLGSYPNEKQRTFVMKDLRRWLNNPFLRIFKRVYIMPESVE